MTAKPEKTAKRGTTISRIALGGVLLVACSGETGNTMPGHQNPAPHNPGHHQGASTLSNAATQFTVDVTDWPSWTRVNRKRFLSEGHNEVWVDIYVPPEHAAAYTDPSGSVNGMRIVMAQYSREHAEEPKNLAVMVRDESTKSNWYWGVYTPGGEETMDSGQIDSCIYCHDRAKDSLFRHVR